MIKNKNKKIFLKQNGFVLLFAVILSSIILAVALGVSNITLKQLTFSTSAKSTNDAFYAADAGVECALYYGFTTASFIDSDGNGQQGQPIFGLPSNYTSTDCANNLVNLGVDGEGVPTSNGPWVFYLLNLGGSNSGKACAQVTVTKDLYSTTIVSKGYNTADLDGGDYSDQCKSSNPNRVERVLEVRY